MKTTPHPLTLGLIALLTGIVLGLSALLIGYLMDWQDPWAVGGFILLIGGGLTWLTLIRWWQRLIETLHGIQEAPVSSEPLRLEILARDSAYLDGTYLDLPFTEQQLIDLGEALVSGASFSHALAGPGRQLSRAEYEQLRDLFLARGLVRWVNPRSHNRGLILTAKGSAVARGFASLAAGETPRLHRHTQTHTEGDR